MKVVASALALTRSRSKMENSDFELGTVLKNDSAITENSENRDFLFKNEELLKETQSNENNLNKEEKHEKSDNKNDSTKTSNITFDPSNYLIMMQIGSGNFSELFMVEHKETKILYTMKTFTKSRVEQLKKQEDILMEKHVMQKIEENDNIIKFYGCSKDEIFLYILYEYVNGGELWRKCVIYGLPSENLIKFYFLQILDGISHMHKHRIVHRDIKV